MQELTVLEKLTLLRCGYAYASAMLFVGNFTRLEALSYQTKLLNKYLGDK